MALGNHSRVGGRLLRQICRSAWSRENSESGSHGGLLVCRHLTKLFRSQGVSHVQGRHNFKRRAYRATRFQRKTRRI